MLEEHEMKVQRLRVEIQKDLDSGAIIRVLHQSMDTERHIEN